MRHIFIILTALFISLSFSSFSEAKARRPAKAYSYFADDGKAAQGVCDGESKIPRRLKRQKEFSGSKEYIGSENLNSELNPNVVSWKHFFKTLNTCNTYLFKVQTPR